MWDREKEELPRNGYPFFFLSLFPWKDNADFFCGKLSVLSVNFSDSLFCTAISTFLAFPGACPGVRIISLFSSLSSCLWHHCGIIPPLLHPTPRSAVSVEPEDVGRGLVGCKRERVFAWKVSVINLFLVLEEEEEKEEESFRRPFSLSLSLSDLLLPLPGRFWCAVLEGRRYP